MFFSEIDQGIGQFQIMEYDDTSNSVKVVAVGGESANFKGKGECERDELSSSDLLYGYTIIAASYEPQDDTLKVTAIWHNYYGGNNLVNHYFLVGEGFKHVKIRRAMEHDRDHIVSQFPHQYGYRFYGSYFSDTVKEINYVLGHLENGLLSVFTAD